MARVHGKAEVVRRLGGLLRKWADRVDLAGAPKMTAWSFTIEDSAGVVFNQDRRGCPVWFVGDAAYDRAHAEQQWTDVDLERPEWITVGYRTMTGEVLVLGSADLTETQLSRRMFGYDELPPDPVALTPSLAKPRAARIPRWHILLNCRMKTFVQVTGKDYPDAVQKMFGKAGRSG